MFTPPIHSKAMKHARAERILPLHKNNGKISNCTWTMSIVWAGRPLLKSSVQSKIHQTLSFWQSGSTRMHICQVKNYLYISLFQYLQKKQKSATLRFNKNLWHANYMQGNHRNIFGKTKTSCHHNTLIKQNQHNSSLMFWKKQKRLWESW